MKFVIFLLIFSFFYLNISDGKAIPVAEDSTRGEDYIITFKRRCGLRYTWNGMECVPFFRPNQSG